MYYNKINSKKTLYHGCICGTRESHRSYNTSLRQEPFLYRIILLKTSEAVQQLVESGNAAHRNAYQDDLV